MIERVARRFRRLRDRLQIKMQIQQRCQTERHGSDYGGWIICPTNINQNSIVYSFGIGDDITFDLSLIKQYGVRVYAFDPTPKSIEWLSNQKLPENLVVYGYGIADFDGRSIFYPPEDPSHISHTILSRDETADKSIKVDVHRLKTIMEMLGHSKIDVLKMDIEGAEYAVIEDLIKERIQINQILVEFHHRFSNVGIEKTRYAVNLLNQGGYKIFHISPGGLEYSFIS